MGVDVWAQVRGMSDTSCATRYKCPCALTDYPSDKSDYLYDKSDYPSGRD